MYLTRDADAAVIILDLDLGKIGFVEQRRELADQLDIDSHAPVIVIVCHSTLLRPVEADSKARPLSESGGGFKRKHIRKCAEPGNGSARGTTDKALVTEFLAR